MQQSSNPEIAERGRRAMVHYEIGAAVNTSDRREKIRKLPVTIIRSDSNDGRVSEFVARGKTRVRLMRSAQPSWASTEVAAAGPSVADDPCYDGEPPCITWQEMEDLAAYAAYTQAEMEALQADFDAQTAAYEEYCSNNPWACDGELPTSGPAETGAKCVGEMIGAASAVVGAASTAVATVAAVQAGAMGGLTLTALGAGLLWGSVAATAAVAVVTVGYATACYLGYTSPTPAAVVSEPAWLN